jgi:hypothetical protein
MRYAKCVLRRRYLRSVEDFPIDRMVFVIRKDEERLDCNFMVDFAWGHMEALNTEIRLWGL